ncbi:MAG: DNA repair protein RecO [Clostridiales Family XIII bacterium]|jgi:DNA repair protein RecO (recombination protein O)|nr:DNA repair protein RecO [Clostridiales Family XIII bacterium]
MDAYTEGIVLRQTKTLNGRRMITLFSKEFGKLGAGTNLAGRGRDKSSLALRPFTYGSYGLRKSRGAWHMNGAEALRGFYRIAEEPEKFANCSYALEFTEKLLPEESPAPALFDLALEYFEMMEARRKKFDTLTAAFLFKAIHLWGAAPELGKCVRCGKEPRGGVRFGVRDGGLVCDDCRETENIPDADKDRLLYPLDFGILNVMRYLPGRPLKSFERLALDEPVLRALKRILREHAAWHLGVGGLKSEEFFNGGLTISRKELHGDGHGNHS